MAIRRTTLAADEDDLAVLRGEARRRGVSLAAVLREAVVQQASNIRRNSKPRFGVVRGDGTATAQIAATERAPAQRRGRS
ncbi:MAG: ribbon-helix-helix protein, CopG family [Mycobacteriales bacterium]